MSANQTNQRITIKGTRDGLTLFMDDTCSFENLLKELHDILTSHHFAEDEPMITVKVELGNRYLNGEQESQLREVIRKQNKLVVDQIVSNVILKTEALEWKEDTEIRLHNKIVRSGQVLHVNGDLLLVGDVNPGGKVIASGNIFVMGNLRGIAHAGVDGNEEAVIAASYMAPNQLRIADKISRSPDNEQGGVHMECGFLDEQREQIIMDRISSLTKARPDLNAFERRIFNG
ncbi:septum site-determining protein MinC [Gracilibacillus sp. YIM 98692]|uniref:septum site-determining protein MinC n=1 Tax=Gracilibacillus sp. YIM 98692 TaxID=2663532 RepID=UPI0013D43DE9|nr:septum site-determining protein MinC [Gracilibacillus sp. YIM 98692]